MSDLGEFLREQGTRTREPGVFDCCTLPADWAVACGLPDPMADWRGRYDTEQGGLEMVAAAGGLVEAFDAGFVGAGARVLSKAEPPQPGDIAVVRVLGEEAGAVYCGKRWALVAGRGGLAFGSLEPQYVARAWRVTNG